MAARILIVDDHPSFRASARALLEADGFEVVGEAVDGHSAVLSAQALLPDVVLLDVQLPDLDGFQVAGRLARAEHKPAVVLTSNRDLADIEPLVSASPARGFVAKHELHGAAIDALVGAA
jgi:DNA-binding NarL/FixJ family response regulator